MSLIVGKTEEDECPEQGFSIFRLRHSHLPPPLPPYPPLPHPYHLYSKLCYSIAHSYTDQCMEYPH